MSSKRNRIIVIIIFLMLVVSSISIIGKNVLFKDAKINHILKTEAYSYLPKTAQIYVKSVYEQTGEVVYTEKNKVENTPYLNPKYIKYLEMSSSERKNVELIPDVYVVDYVPSEDIIISGDLPSKYTLDNVSGKNYTSPSGDQGNLGLCWAFATASVAESHLMLKKGQSFNSNSERFSERQLDYATSFDGIKNYENPLGVRTLGSGATTYQAFEAIAAGLTLVNKNNWQYDYNSMEKRGLFEVLNFDNSTYELNSSITMPIVTTLTSDSTKQKYRDELKNYIKNYGGAIVSTVGPEGTCSFKNYDGTNAIIDTNDCSDGAGHAMHIIGWDDNYSYKYCDNGSSNSSVNANGTCSSGTLVSGTGAWILKNSWGTSYMSRVYLVYASVNDSMGIITSLTSMNNRNWDNQYYKSMVSPGDTEDTVKISSVNSQDIKYTKKVNTPEKIEKIKFYASNSDGKFTVSVITNSKTYNDIKTVSTTHPGMYTIDLSSNDIVLNDSSFTIRLDGAFLDRFYQDSISVFTSNVNDDINFHISALTADKAIIDERYNFKYIVSGYTKNVDSNTEVTFELYQNGKNYNDYIISVTDNRIAMNNFVSELVLDGGLPSGNYRLYVRTGVKYTIIDIGVPVNVQGSKQNPYLIYNETDLINMKNDLNAYYLLMNNITLTKPWTPLGTLTQPFTGGFDGGSHRINNLKIESGSSYMGFFGRILVQGDDQYIKNVTFSNPLVSNNGGAAILIGQLGYIYESSIPSDIYAFNIENVHFIGGRVNTGAVSGIIVSRLFNAYKENSSVLNINNVFSSTNVFGVTGSGLIGSVESSAENKIQVNMSNIQNVGQIELDNKVFTADDRQSPLIGKANNAVITLKNYIINSSFNSLTYEKDFVKNKKNYYLGSFDSTVDFQANSGYYLSKYADGVNSVTSFDIKSVDFKNEWQDFDKYWRVETIGGIKRIPVLKKISYDYTTTTHISLNKNQTLSLTDYLMRNYQYLDYEIVSNDNVISINDNLLDDIIITGLNEGVSTIKLISHYDGYERNINVYVDTEIVYPVITYYSNNEDNNITNIQTLTSFDSVLLKANLFVKGGYNFVGWNTEPDGSGKSYTDKQEVIITDDLTLYAQWLGKPCKIKFLSNGGSGLMPDQLGFYGDSANIDSNIFTRDGYTFAGWNTKSDGSGKNYTDKEEITLTGDLGLYAQWIVTEYDVIFNFNGGLDNTITQKIKHNINTKLNKNSFSRNGYNFIGWNTEPDGSGINYSDEHEITITNNITLYAQWEALESIITFNSNGGTGYMEQQKYIGDNLQKISKNTFAKDGYTFVGWNRESDGSGNGYVDEQEIMVTENVTLYAQWEMNEYNVTFDMNDGTNNIKKQNFIYNTSFKLNKNGFVREHYIFIGWNTESDGSGEIYVDEQEIRLINDLTLYAQWEPLKYMITFDSNGGRGIMNNQTYTYGILQRLNDNQFIRDGYLFVGWNTQKDGSGDIYTDKQDIAIDDNVTLYAQWIINDYNVTFNSNDGTNNTKNQKFIYNSNDKLDKNTFAREHYIFIGWNTESDGSGENYDDEQEISITNDLTLYAQWEANEYEITFYSRSESNNIIIQSITYGLSHKLMKNIFVREGYLFVGWNTDVDGRGTPYVDEEVVTLVDDISLYAQWEPLKYMITFDANGGSGIMNNQTYTYGILQRLNDNQFIRDGYKFVGWNTQKDGSEKKYSNGQEVTITNDLTLYAQWEKSFSYVINKYLVDEVNKYIDISEINITLDNFNKNITLGDGYTVDVDTKNVKGNDVLYTGGKTKIYYNGSLYSEYTNIVRGDANGDGNMNIFDYIRIMKDIMGEVKLDSVYKIAADINQNGKVDIFDYIRIMKEIMEAN